MIKRKNKNVGEPLTLDSLFKELNELFKDDTFAKSKDDPKYGNIRSMISSLANDEAEFSEKEEEVENENDDSCDGLICYGTVKEATNDPNTIGVTDSFGVEIPTIAFVAAPQMMDGVVETIRAMDTPIIVAFEDGIVTKAFIAKGDTRKQCIEDYGVLPALSFEEKGGLCRLSINCKDGYDFILGENGNTRFIIFDEDVCPSTIPTDIVMDDRKWGKRMSKEIPQLIEKRIEESKSEEKLPFADAVTPALTKIDIPILDKKTSVGNLPETVVFNDCPHDVKKPIIENITKDYNEAKQSGKIGNDTFIEFLKPENKETVEKAVNDSLVRKVQPNEDISEPTNDEIFASKLMDVLCNPPVEEEDEEEVVDTNPDCFRCIVDYMAKERIDSVKFWTDDEGRIHCDVSIKTVYEPELTNLND